GDTLVGRARWEAPLAIGDMLFSLVQSAGQSCRTRRLEVDVDVAVPPPQALGEGRAGPFGVLGLPGTLRPLPLGLRSRTKIGPPCRRRRDHHQEDSQEAAKAREGPSHHASPPGGQGYAERHIVASALTS